MVERNQKVVHKTASDAKYISLPPSVDLSAQGHQVNVEKDRRSLKQFTARRQKRLARSLRRDYTTFKNLLEQKSTSSVDTRLTLKAYQIFARSKMLVDVKFAGESRDWFNELVAYLHSDPEANSHWGSLEAYARVITRDADTNLAYRHFVNLQRVVQDAVLTRTPRHWIELLTCGWTVSYDQTPPHHCRNCIPYTRRLRQRPHLFAEH